MLVTMMIAEVEMQIVRLGGRRPHRWRRPILLPGRTENLVVPGSRTMLGSPNRLGHQESRTLPGNRTTPASRIRPGHQESRTTSASQTMRRLQSLATKLRWCRGAFQAMGVLQSPRR